MMLINIKKKCSKNVVLLSIGLHANVISVWKKICWTNYTSDSVIERRAVRSALRKRKVEASQAFMCRGGSLLSTFLDSGFPLG
jgi:hypothetical protein